MDLDAKVILLAEDDENDILLARRAAKRAGIAWPIQAVKDGEEAKKYLRGDGIYGDRSKYPFPCMLVTDLKMPRCDGLELLKWIRENPPCRVVPTVILSASPSAEDVRRAYELGANCYLCKPTSFERLVALFAWLRTFCEEALFPDSPKKCD